jgi:hypothetical protein
VAPGGGGNCAHALRLVKVQSAKSKQTAKQTPKQEVEASDSARALFIRLPSPDRSPARDSSLPQAFDFARNPAALKGLVSNTCPNKDLLNSATTRQSTAKAGGCDAAAFHLQSTIWRRKSCGARSRLWRKFVKPRIGRKISIQAEII